MTKLIIITGISSSGKTTYCSAVNKPLITFDNVFNYATLKCNYSMIRQFIEKNKSSDVIFMDAYIWHLDKQLEKLKSTFNNNITSIEIIHIYASLDKTAITSLNRVKRGDYPTPGSLDYSDLINNVVINVVQNIDNTCNKLKSEGIITKLSYIYRNNDNKYEYYNDNQHLKKVLIGYGMSDINYFLKYINKISGAPKYQTMEINNKVVKYGSEKCWLSWNNILKIGIQFKDKSVCDLGCFNGYFSIKFKRAGATTVTGYDVNVPALKISKLNALYNNIVCLFIKKNMGKDVLFTKKYDIIVALNVLHHVARNNTNKDYKQVLDDIFKNCNEALFEINNKEITDIKIYAEKNNFKLSRTIKSHRNTMFGQRYILYFCRNK